jgi:hypothetical protein
LLNHLVHKKVAFINDSDKIRVKFIVENITLASIVSNNAHISSNISNNNLNLKDSIFLQRKIFFDNNLIDGICKKFEDIESFVSCNISYLSRSNHVKKFPANVVRLKFKRKFNQLHKFKSKDSIQRHRKKCFKQKNDSVLFENLNIAFEFFPAGNINSAGCQTKEDIMTLLTLYQIIYHQIFNYQ